LVFCCLGQRLHHARRLIGKNTSSRGGIQVKIKPEKSIIKRIEKPVLLEILDASEFLAETTKITMKPEGEGEIEVST
jgi:hypothetical protein